MTKYITKLISGDQMYYLKDTEAREALVDKTEKGVANGIATLDSSGKVPSSQLPSYVDDVLEGYSHNGQFYATLTPGEEGEPDTYSDLITPETGKIYVDKATNNTFRWSGSAYIMIGSSGGGGYTAGSGIDITNAEISVDNTVLRSTDVDSTIPSTSSSNVPTSDAVKSYTESSLQQFNNDYIDIPNKSDAEYYTQEEADAYNALLTGALNSTDLLTAEQATAYNEAVPLKVADNTLSEAESVAYNAQLTGALDSMTPLTAEQAAAYTEVFPDDPKEEGDFISDYDAEIYNAQLTDALDYTTPLTAEQASAFNTAFPAKEAGDTLLTFQANNYNATLDGAVSINDVKTPAVPNTVKDYVDDKFVPKVYGVATKLAVTAGGINPMLPEAISKSSIALDGYIGMGGVAGGDFNQISSVIKPSPSGDLKYAYKENGVWTDHKMWHEGNDGSGSGLDADMLDGLDDGDFTRKYAYSIPYGKGVRIFCGSTYGALIFGRSTAGASNRIVLIGTGYSSTAGSGRNHWKCIDKGGNVSWTNASTTDRCVEIMNTHTSGSLEIYVISPMSTVTFTEITALSGTAVTDVVAVASGTITSGQVMIADGTSGSIESSGYTIAKSVPSDAEFTDTHYTTHIYAGGSKAKANAAVTSPYITVVDDTTYRNQVRLIGDGATTVSSDGSGNITISSTDNDTDNYRYITYTTNVVENSSASLSLDGRIPVHFVTTTANITGLTLSSNPPDGHECHVLITASSSKTVTIAYNSSSRVTPDKNSITLTIPAGGYVEVNFIRVNSKTYVRAI